MFVFLQFLLFCYCLFVFSQILIFIFWWYPYVFCAVKASFTSVIFFLTIFCRCNYTQKSSEICYFKQFLNFVPKTNFSKINAFKKPSNIQRLIKISQVDILTSKTTKVTKQCIYIYSIYNPGLNVLKLSGFTEVQNLIFDSQVLSK